MAGKERKTVFLDEVTIGILDKEIEEMKEKGYDANYSDVINAMIKMFYKVAK